MTNPFDRHPLARLAMRNLTRHSSRNVLLAGSIGLAAGLLAFVLCVGDGIRTQLVRGIVDAEAGAVMIEARTAFRNLPAAGRAERLAAAKTFALRQPGVRSVRERVVVRAVMYAHNKSADVQLTGVRAPAEGPLIRSVPLLEGAFVTAARATDVTIGEATAQRLGIHSGDDCELMTQTVNGGINVVDCRVGGVFRAASRWSNAAVYADLSMVKTLYDVDGPTQLLIDLDRLDRAGAVATSVRGAFPARDSVFTVSTYRSRAGLASSIANVNSVSLAVLVGCLLLIAAVGVSTAVIANVSDRIGELGTLSALGFSRGEILRVLLMETMGLSAGSAAIGLAIAAIAAGVCRAMGLDIGSTASLAFGVRTLRPDVTIMNFVYAAVVATLLPVAFAFLPARRGARLDPVEALRAATL